MDVLEIAPGLWRWTGRHEEWEEDVGSVYFETEDGVVLIDPIVPPEDSDRFLETLDREVTGTQVHVLVTVFWHTRDAAAMVERYGARVWAPARGKSGDRPARGHGQRPLPGRRPAARRGAGAPDGARGRGRLLDPAARSARAR